MRVTTPLGFTMELAGPWLDVTDDLPAGSPFTLAQADGFGVFQFSSGLYRGGLLPTAGDDVLREMLRSFGKEKGLGEPAHIRVHKGSTASVGGSFQKGDCIRAWYVTDGRSFIFASHTSGETAAEELAQCEAMIRSIEFEKNRANQSPEGTPGKVTFPAAESGARRSSS
ncbi:MAG: hypothetical protein BWY06_02883 [Candidatus Latescibacteria bacterium ADurb.Bin168]|nr:MAG: hypothetical protein BWY06_02883 [Candidatus Latescibacteria bacterium ADurb.Bin168]